VRILKEFKGRELTTSGHILGVTCPIPPGFT